MHDLCTKDFFGTVAEVNPSLNDSTGVQSKSISNDTVARMAKTVLMKKEKKQMLHKLQELASQLIDLWNLMDTHPEERKLFDHAEVDVERLYLLKSSRMKEIAFKKQAELEGIFAHAHVEIDSEAVREKIMPLVDSGNIEAAELLADMNSQIVKVKE